MIYDQFHSTLQISKQGLMIVNLRLGFVEQDISILYNATVWNVVVGR
jgi:hypothetical protein